jgi:uncharacterized protein YfaS (alpha-2-macroglobulin family)
MIRLRNIVLFLALLLVGQAAASPPAPPALDRAMRADGTRVIPDRFLRAWDPLTVFFPADAGPKAGGPEDTPQRWVTLDPPTPGAWQWLSARVLQFRPADPWQALRRVHVSVGGTAAILVPLLPVPTQTGAADDASGIADLDRLALSFPSPVDEAALARLMTIDLRPQPGLTTDKTVTLTAQDFTITPVERAKRGDPQTYMVVLHRPVPDGQVAILRLRLSDEPGLDTPIFETRLHSAVPFAFTEFNCASGFGNSTTDGVRSCAPNDDSAGTQPRGLELSFTAPPQALDAVHVRDVMRITPHVDALIATSDNTTLRLTGAFRAATVYTLTMPQGSLHDTRGRGLGATAPLQFAFAAAAPTLRWDASQGIVERFGPQMLPMRGQGYTKADLRIHPIDNASRDFWPFPQAGVVTGATMAPPLPGKEPAPWDQPGPIGPDDLALRLAALGSPSISTLPDLPVSPGGLEQKFGLDVSPLLSRIAGEREPGAYLLGIRPVDAQDRHWLRVQVTDLSLTAVEEAESVRFLVTSLATAKPVPGATIQLQQAGERDFDTIARGVTAADGSFTWNVPQYAGGDRAASLSRVMVTKGADTMVIDPRHGPPQYTSGGWGHGGANWLGWAASGNLKPRREQPRLLCHVFTERPIYRPEENVRIAGMVRSYQAGSLSFAHGDGGVIIVTGPDKQEWKLPAKLDDVGGFHLTFDAKTIATGDYTVAFRPGGKQAELCDMSFKKEAYRLPTFEVLLTGAQKVALDQPFTVDLLARWFAGGLVSDRPVSWRVTQFPYVWSPPGRDGFAFSSDSRFSGDVSFRSTPVLNRNVKTDAGGATQLVLDPTIEPTAQPREYVVEATVTGDDDMQVRSVQHVVALPPFVLGVKLPRYIPHAVAIDPELLALDGQGHALPGLQMTVKLIRRNWNSVLQASDFAAGAAKYDTQVIDETIAERKITSAADAVKLHFDTPQSGVYIVELTAADKAGRTQTVRLDSFLAGDTPVTWSQPPAQTVTLSPDKNAYLPGETATVLIESPFQTARALAVVEQPEGPFTYQWIDVAHGFGRIAVPIRKQQMPKLAVHVLLMRGRLSGPPPSTAAPFDLGKPTTVAATVWLTVTPVENQLRVNFDAPASARPAQEIDLVVHLSDPAGHPLAGEATVWMVDQAVLSLAKEQPLDPLPSFIVQRPSRMVARDTRNQAFGIIPLSEAPGGGAGGEQGAENISVRKNFTPVPLYVPRVKFGSDGVAVIHVKLPDTLTVYMLRAKAISGPDRFGFGTGSMKIRLPLVAQPVLPRFVRPGDRFTAAVIGRLVEGAGGPGTATAALQGVTLQGAASETFTWNAGHPARIEFPVAVPMDAAGSVRLRFTLKRDADGAGDAVQLDLPVQPDRPMLHERLTGTLPAGISQTIAPLAEEARPGTYRRSVILAADPLLVRIVGGLQFLLQYPFGCTEQRLALTGSELEMKPYAAILNAAGVQDRLARDFASTQAEIAANTDANGLVAYWPQTKGSVLLTAWSYDFMVRADRAGLPVDKAMRTRMQKVLEQALRSDYPHLFSDAAVLERANALWALAEGGDLQPAYAAELARRAVELSTGGLAQVISAITHLPTDSALLPALGDELWRRVQTRLQDGDTVYAGLTDEDQEPLILPSEARSLSNVTEAVATVTPQEPRLPMLRQGLLRIADGDGWGNTNATAAALRALAASWQLAGHDITVQFQTPSAPPQHGAISAATPLLEASTRQTGPIGITAATGAASLALLIDTDYVPAPPGSAATAVPHGFVLGRSLFRVPAEGPMQRLSPASDGSLHVQEGDVIEEVDELVNPEARTNVAMRLPLPAGMEPLNPNLATAPANAAPSAAPTLAPDYAAYGDDQVLVVYQTLPQGTYIFRTRMRATVDGSFTESPSQVETMYRRGVTGSSDGARVVIGP